MYCFSKYEKTTGRVLSKSTSTSEYDILLNETETIGVYVGQVGPNQYILNGEPVYYPPKPDPSYEFNYTTHAWEDMRTLEQVQATKWTEIKKARETAEEGGFTWDGSTFDSDPRSQSRILGAQQVSAITPNYLVTWTLADNTTRELNAADLLSLSQALGTHVPTQFSKAQGLRTQIDNATTIEEVLSITW